MIDRPWLPFSSWSSFAGAQIDLTRLGWIDRTRSSFRLEAEGGDVGFYHLRRDFIDLAPGSVEPVEKMGEALRIGTKGVSRPPQVAQMQQKRIDGRSWGATWSHHEKEALVLF